MISELRHTQNPWRARLGWAGVYVAVLCVLAFMFYRLYWRIQTYSLPTGGVTLSVPYGRYLVGETVSFTVTNNFNSPVYVSNGCPSEPLNVYRYENGAWQPIHQTTDIKNCDNQARSVLLEPQHSTTATFANWPQLFATPGKYRIAMQVQYYNAVPYQDFEVVEAPLAALQSPPRTTSQPSLTSQGNSVSTQTSKGPSSGGSVAPIASSTPPSAPTPAPTQPSRTPQTYVLTVNSSGNYNLTSLTLYVGDSVQIVYQKPYSGEVRTRFTGINGTTATIQSVTVDSEFTSRTRTFTATGSWRYKADDHNGNSGIITVSN